VDAALELQQRARYDDWTVQQVATRAGVAKGTVFLYFATKEALGLAMLRRLLEGWLAEVESGLSAPGRAPTTAAVAQLMGRTLADRPELRQLLALRSTRLEHNVPSADAESFGGWLLERLQGTGARLEAALPFLQAGEGARLMVLVQALVVGYQAGAEPSPVMATLLARPEFGPLRVDARRAVSEALWMQLEGLRATRSAARREAVTASGAA